MAEERLARKLAAILYADVAGYSRLTGQDEEGTHRVLRRYLDLISASIPRYEGRVVHYAGDAVLADFSTVSEALVCAAVVQRELARCNDALPEERRVEFRIGVNLGEVIVDRQDIYGDGVNVAARLEALAEPGGICVSEAVRGAVGGKLAFDFDFLGEQGVGVHQPPELDEGAHDRDVHFHGTGRMQHTGEHGDTWSFDHAAEKALIQTLQDRLAMLGKNFTL